MNQKTRSTTYSTSSQNNTRLTLNRNATKLSSLTAARQLQYQKRQNDANNNGSGRSNYNLSPSQQSLQNAMSLLQRSSQNTMSMSLPSSQQRQNNRTNVNSSTVKQAINGFRQTSLPRQTSPRKTVTLPLVRRRRLNTFRRS